LLITVSLAAVALTAGIALAAINVIGSPAPQDVVDDFAAYPPQLGYQPDGGSARLVAVDGAFALYATTSRDGTSCVITSAPWRRPGKSSGDGGVCIPQSAADLPVVASITAASEVADNDVTFVVVGRVKSDEAREVNFATPEGDELERELGPGGFFIAGVQHSCNGKNWAPTFIATDAQGATITRATITLSVGDRHSATAAHTCGGFEGTPHGPYAFDPQPK
jgi:hypothetical protein